MDLTEPDAGSDLQAVQLKATYSEADGVWYLNGVKRFITNGDAQIKLVLARSEEGTSDGRGLSYFVADNKHDDTVKVRRIENKLGIKGSPTCELVFTNTPAKLVGARRMGLIKCILCKVYHFIVDFVCNLFTYAVFDTAFYALFPVSIYEALTFLFHYCLFLF
jgi:hypothetical protein